ncbi:hypothetical protein ES288_D06G185600v1 [Gossypium darwinii]|uniref:FAS1 domain-containing protein n=1 Tax=Gossypium darwinii TaxID=34276 RepID=A0A5D2C9V9_GOSDA|nr:hypothetical protein GOBAR_DD07394 [Gossypium barbadense]TYG65438.1 hypothetical protein ES288_D06G185600v1 [Gossypium darwinii]
MSPMSSPIVALFLAFFLLLSAADAFNITKILGSFSDYSTFNDLLTQTGVASEINDKKSVTVLVVSNSQISGLSSQPKDTIKKMLSIHVVLDYYDKAKVDKVPSKPLTLTTLYQQSGKAQNQQGFLTMTRVGKQVSFGSAAPGSSHDSIFVKQVTTQPYDISVLEISNVINVAITSSPSYAPNASPPRKALAPGPNKSPLASPPKTTRSDIPAADAPSTTTDSDASDNTSAASIASASAILFIFASACFMLTMI